MHRRHLLNNRARLPIAIILTANGECLFMPRKDLEDAIFKLLEKGKSIEEIEAIVGKQGWGQGDMWYDWALAGAIRRFHKKHGKTDAMRTYEYLYFIIAVLLVIFVMSYFSRPRA